MGAAIAGTTAQRPGLSDRPLQATVNIRPPATIPPPTPKIAAQWVEIPRSTVKLPETKDDARRDATCNRTPAPTRIRPICRQP
jgi:hypothetical protein